MFWTRPKSPVAEATPPEAHERVTRSEALMVDVREPAEWRTVRAAGARHLPLRDLGRHAAELPKDMPIYLICASGNRSRTAAGVLLAAGFASPVSVRGGMNAWIRAGLPVERG